MRIGIDARVLGTNKALERYARSLLTHLFEMDKKNDYVLFTDDRKKVQAWEDKASAFLLPPKKVLTDHLRFSRLIKSAQVDLVFHPDNTEFFNCHPKSIVTLHDVIPWKFPDMILSQNPLLRACQILYFKLQEAALKKATKIITVSKTSKKDINQIIGISEEKITVIYEGIDESFAKKIDKKVLQRYKIDPNFIFYIGGFSPHKNVLSLVKAFALISNEFPKLKLVLGGKSEETKGGKSAFGAIMAEIVKNNLNDKVVFTGFIKEDDLASFYQNAKVFVYPSLYEGFGFPPLEAMKAGTPVVASSRASLGEILGDSVYQTEVSNPQELANSITEVLVNSKLTDSLIKKGREKVKFFTWEKTAQETIEVFNQFKN